jgi:electron transport complex protein RnfG
MAVAALILGGFAVLGTALVGLTFTGTREIIAENERQALLANLNALVPPERYTNDVTEDSIQVTDPELLGSSEPVTVYRAFRGNQPVALFATPIAPDGYGGPIKLLVGVYPDGTLAGVRTLAHRETPGLGDAIDTARSDWMLSFSGKSLSQPGLEKWAVRRDGGDFDQFTGATITPRAVVKAVRNFLVYFTRHREQLFLARSSTTTPEGSP